MFTETHQDHDLVDNPYNLSPVWTLDCIIERVIRIPKGYRKYLDHLSLSPGTLPVLDAAILNFWRYLTNILPFPQTRTDRRQCKLLCLIIFPKYIPEVIGTWSTHSRHTHNLLTWTVLHACNWCLQKLIKTMIWSTIHMIFLQFGRSTA